MNRYSTEQLRISSLIIVSIDPRADLQPSYQYADVTYRRITIFQHGNNSDKMQNQPPKGSLLQFTDGATDIGTVDNIPSVFAGQGPEDSWHLLAAPTNWGSGPCTTTSVPRTDGSYPFSSYDNKVQLITTNCNYRFAYIHQ